MGNLCGQSSLQPGHHCANVPSLTRFMGGAGATRNQTFEVVPMVGSLISFLHYL